MTRDEIKSLLIDHGCDHPSGELLDRLASEQPRPSQEVIENMAREMACVIARRHGSGHTPDDWMSNERREEALAAYKALASHLQQPAEPARGDVEAAVVRMAGMIGRKLKYSPMVALTKDDLRSLARAALSTAQPDTTTKGEPRTDAAEIGFRARKTGDPAHDAVMEDLARRIDDE